MVTNHMITVYGHTTTVSPTNHIHVPDRIIPHDFPSQLTLVHGVRKVGGDVVNGWDEAIPQRRDRDTTMHTEHL